MLEGVFLEEGKTRFVAWVNVGGKRSKAYVPTSTKLSRFLKPVGMKVRLQEGLGHLEVSAIRIGTSWVYLRSSYANQLLERRLINEEPKKEQTLFGYRFDLLTKQGVCYEVKSIITTMKRLWYPNAPSERREKQLKKTIELLKKGVKIEWALVSLSPTLQEIFIDPRGSFGRLLIKALKSGLSLSAWKIYRGCKLKEVQVVLNQRPRV